MSDCIRNIDKCINADKLCNVCTENVTPKRDYYAPKPFEVWLLTCNDRTILNTSFSEESIRNAKLISGGTIRHMREIEDE